MKWPGFFATAVLIYFLKVSPGWCLSPTEIETHLKPLKTISISEFERLSQIDPMVFDEGTKPEHVLQVPLEEARRILNSLIEADYGPMELIAHPFFISDPRILYFPRETLTVLYKEYFVSTPFAVRGVLSHPVSNVKGIVPIGTYFEQEGLLLGRGRVVHLYPFHISVKRKEPNYAFFTGAYDFFRVNVMDIKSTAEEFVLFNLRGRDQPDDDIRPFKGPLNAPIKKMKMPKTRDKVVVYTGFSRWSFPIEKYEKISPPLYDRTPSETKIPEGVVLESKRLATAKQSL